MYRISFLSIYLCYVTPPPLPCIVSLCMLFCFLFCIWLKIHHIEQCPTHPDDNHLQNHTNVLLSQFVNIPFWGSWHFFSLQFLAALPRALTTLCARLMTGCLVTWWPTAVYLATSTSASRALVNAPVTAVVPGSPTTPTLIAQQVRRKVRRERAGEGGNEDRIEKNKNKNEHERKDTTAPPTPNKKIK